jgi:glycosyltransferase involved in cell wall biosynthesis
MRILVWGRFGAGPRVAHELADGLRAAGADSVILSLAESAEILNAATPPMRCELTVPTYDSPAGFGYRLLTAPIGQRSLRRNIAVWRPDIAICAMPALLDLSMASALAALRIPFAAIVHDADLHPGDGLPMQMRIQRRLMARADALITLSDHVERRVREQLGVRPRQVFLKASLPPFRFGPPAAAPRAHGGPLRLLSFGRLLPYKGLDLLAGALRALGPRDHLEVRVVGQGPESGTLAELRAIPSVTVENRWVPEAEIASLLAWSDALVLPYREASQSGVAAAAISARRWVVATRVGGLEEQFRNERLALLCDPDEDSIAAAIERLIALPPESDDGAPRPDDWPATAGALIEQLGNRFGPFPKAGLAFGASPQAPPGAEPLDFDR